MKTYLKKILVEFFDDYIDPRLRAIEQGIFVNTSHLKETAELLSQLAKIIEESKRQVIASEAANAVALAEEQASTSPLARVGNSWPRLKKALEEQDRRELRQQFNADAAQVEAYWKAKSLTAGAWTPQKENREERKER